LEDVFSCKHFQEKLAIFQCLVANLKMVWKTFLSVWLELENALKTPPEITTTVTPLTQNQHTQQQNHHTNTKLKNSHLSKPQSKGGREGGDDLQWLIVERED
jgi:hypothetical protein